MFESGAKHFFFCAAAGDANCKWLLCPRVLEISKKNALRHFELFLVKELEHFEVQSAVLVSVGGVACTCGGWVWWVVTWEVGGGIRGV